MTSAAADYDTVAAAKRAQRMRQKPPEALAAIERAWLEEYTRRHPRGEALRARAAHRAAVGVPKSRQRPAAAPPSLDVPDPEETSSPAAEAPLSPASVTSGPTGPVGGERPLPEAPPAAPSAGPPPLDVAAPAAAPLDDAQAAAERATMAARIGEYMAMLMHWSCRQMGAPEAPRELAELARSCWTRIAERHLPEGMSGDADMYIGGGVTAVVAYQGWQASRKNKARVGPPPAPEEAPAPPPPPPPAAPPPADVEGWA
jgi:hypothetical protein